MGFLGVNFRFQSESCRSHLGVIPRLYLTVKTLQRTLQPTLERKYTHFLEYAIFFIVFLTSRRRPSRPSPTTRRRGEPKPRLRRRGAAGGAAGLCAPRESNDQAKRNATQRRRRPRKKKRHPATAHGTTPEPPKTPTKPKPTTKPKETPSAAKRRPARRPAPKPTQTGVTLFLEGARRAKCGGRPS